ncbi:hypothetical protein GBF38_006284 [Nibea albiflora]|uniref:Uncharacterized protein n=1 Tax=Nibea albiflora TaxID=240163 RepID=A0ACB7FAC9_NIBAL|nr:hypothetical protein GBF38_006284 [Nibea albiflora]
MTKKAKGCSDDVHVRRPIPNLSYEEHFPVPIYFRTPQEQQICYFNESSSLETRQPVNAVFYRAALTVGSGTTFILRKADTGHSKELQSWLFL